MNVHNMFGRPVRPRGIGQHRGNPRNHFLTRRSNVGDHVEHDHINRGMNMGCSRGRYSRGNGHQHAAKNLEDTQIMRESLMEHLLGQHPNEILMALVAPRSGFQKTLQQPERNTVETFLVVIAKACEAVGKQETLNHVLQQINSSGFLTGSVIMYITECVMFPGNINYDATHAICKILKKLLDHIPGASSENVTSVLAQLSNLHAIMPQGSDKDCTGDHIGALTEQQRCVVGLIQGGFLVKQSVSKHSNEDDKTEPQDNFRQIPVMPEAQDLHSDIEPFLRKNKISGSYRDVDQYLDIQFRLLREDYLMPLRQGIRELKRSGTNVPDNRYIQDVRIYDDVQNMGIWYSEKGVVCRLCFDNSRLKRIRWEVSKRLIFGSLLCLSPDNFTTFVIGTVAERDPQLLKEGYIDVLIQDFRHFDPDYFVKYKMVECSAYFEAYRYNLEGLQDLNEDKLPFKDYFLNTRYQPSSPPRYLVGNTSKYDFKPLLTTSLPNVRRNVLDKEDWPKASELGLDESQYRALQLSLTNEFAIIQGPPGTGKTFIGLKIVQLLLHNFNIWGIGLRGEARLHRVNCPILLVCYTNHALDQFLEGILQFTDVELGQIVRVGGRSKVDNDAIQKCLLSNLKRNRDFKIRSDVREAKGATLEQMKGQENNLAEIGKTLTMLRTHIFHETQLLHVMSLQHRQSFEYLMEINNVCYINKWLLHDAPQNMFRVEQEEQWDYGIDNGTEGELATSSEAATSKYDIGFEVNEEIQHIEQERQFDDSGDEKEERIGEKSKRILDETFSNFHDSRNCKQGKKNMKLGMNEWQTVRSAKHVKQTVRRELNKEERMSEQEEAMVADIWLLPSEKRWSLYRLWRHRYSQDISFRMISGIDQFNQLARRLKEIRDEEDYHALINAKVIAMTTTGAAKYRHILDRIQPRIVIVEEAAEVLEAHIITSLSANCQHLILIGDHQQLRPNPTVYKLAKKYHLDISLFERMLMNNMHCECLEIQHRMRPEIAKLIVPHIYKSLLNHESVLEYENVRGIKGNLFFVQHEHAENETVDTRSRTNAHEAEYVSALCRYLIQQGYTDTQVTILTTYTGQMFEIKRRVRQDPLTLEVRVTPVDNYQGEENDIILLSLVRSNEEGNIGFLKTANRVCVALSRAKKGFYVIGDMKLMRESSKIWSNITDELDADEKLVNGLPLFCQNHPDTGIHAVNAQDFTKAPNGGCSRPCEVRLKCGHVCQMKCHPADPEHKKYQCEKPCTKTPCPVKHACPKMCYEECGKCEVLVNRTIPKCGHDAKIPCHVDPATYICQAACERILRCNHICSNICGVPCVADGKCMEIIMSRSWPCGHKLDVECYRNEDNYPCPKEVKRTLSCGHNMTMKCSDDPDKISCMTTVQLVLCHRKCQNNVSCFMKEKIVAEGCQVVLEKTCEKNEIHKFKTKCCEYDSARCKCPCKELLPCGHNCQGVCGKCSDTANHKSCEFPCQRILLCQHPCKGKCGSPCLSCDRPCRNGCTHTLCRHRCGNQCTQCRAPCSWSCQHKQCNRTCSQSCDREPCNERCPRLLQCHHRCAGYCGEPCPSLCPICNAAAYEQMHKTLSSPMKKDKYVILMPCLHTITCTYMDMFSQRYLEDAMDRPKELKIFQCPLCSVPIQHCPRYQRAVRLSCDDMEKMKKFQNASDECHKILSRSNFGRTLAILRKEQCIRKTSRPVADIDIRKCIGCLGLLNEIRATIDKIRNAKNKVQSAEAIVQLDTAHKTYEDDLKNYAPDGVDKEKRGLSALPLKLSMFYLRCVLLHMLTYVKSFFKQKALRDILVDVEREEGAGSRSSMRQMLIRTNARIVASLPFGLRNGVEDYTEEVDKFFDIHVDFLVEKKWIICEQDHAFPVPITFDVRTLENACTRCQAPDLRLSPDCGYADEPDDIEKEFAALAIDCGLGVARRFAVRTMGTRFPEIQRQRLARLRARRIEIQLPIAKFEEPDEEDPLEFEENPYQFEDELCD